MFRDEIEFPIHAYQATKGFPMSDNTVGTLRNEVKQISSPPDKLRVIPDSGICRVNDLIEFMGISGETIALWRMAELKIINDVGTNADFIDLRVLNSFLNSSPKLPQRPNRKKRKK